MNNYYLPSLKYEIKQLVALFFNFLFTEDTKYLDGQLLGIHVSCLFKYLYFLEYCLRTLI